MPALRKIAFAGAVVVVVAAIFATWVGWPVPLSIVVGAVFGLVMLIVATSLGDDPTAADAAWRARAGDLGQGAGRGTAAGPAAGPQSTAGPGSAAGPGPEDPG